ncbi:hypothetical protein DPSP01_011469 [Paraphaeosphaeria sporulosa]|uniref:RTA1-domain-containing protein n=1 Tax=Paraphaeosphaeria sporulosa TaxID=1460663 RepID=A0A177CWF4_9PLEO|nr:uncharacterized protein CC84DRAFT_55527 [Paraphaeosphaeria sporulosa]OAG11843.1 hypothetical protein CC84DRAFT_55527 [Paraphaeosphaeria sporulosa]
MATPTATQSTTGTTSTSTPFCTTAIPGQYGFVPPDACNAQWAYSPSFAAAVAFSALFGMLFIAHFALAILFRKGFSWVMIMGVSWEFIAFVTRALGAHDQQSQAFSFTATLLFLLAPLWVNAYVYMTAGRLIWTYHPNKKVWGFKAISLGKYFVWLDVFSFLVQAVGGLMLSPGASASTMTTGKNIYMTGVGVQQLFILLFFALIVRFQIELQRFERNGAGWLGKRWQWVTYALYAALALITMRIIFRLIEFSAGAGVDNPLPYHEKYALALDAFPMSLAILILAVIHPGLALKGPESEFPSRKERKAEKKQIKAAKKAGKQDRKMARTRGDVSITDVEMNRI